MQTSTKHPSSLSQATRACVTGGAGFIGSTLVDRLVREGHDVVVLDDLSTGSLENLAGVRGAIEFVEGDLRDLETVTRCVRGADVVYHQAALTSVARSVEDPKAVIDVNVGGTLNVLLASKDAGVRRVVFASSSSVYGDTPDLPKTETMALTPRSPYAASKAAGEGLLGAFQACYGLETVSLRYFNVYGPRQSPRSAYAAVVPLFAKALREGRPATIHGDGGQTRDFTYVDDVVAALLRAGERPEALQGPINVGGGNRISILDLAHAVARELGVEIPPVHVATRVGDVRDSLADIGRARRWLAWEPQVDIQQGIARIVAGLKGTGQPVGAGEP